jgi:hypothetical protein
MQLINEYEYSFKLLEYYVYSIQLAFYRNYVQDVMCWMLLLCLQMAMCIIMCHVKTTIKEASYLQVSIVTIKNLITLLIKGKWLEVVVSMLRVNFFIQTQNKFTF